MKFSFKRKTYKNDLNTKVKEERIFLKIRLSKFIQEFDLSVLE
jgi:hypothetical protein